MNTRNITSPPPKRQLMYYSLLGAPIAMLGIPLYLYLPLYYHESYGLSLAVIGLALLAARLFDVFTDPLMGWLSDRIHRRFNRTLQILMGLFLLLFSVFQLFFPNPEHVTAWTLFIWSFFTYLAWTWVQVPYLSLATEITQHDFGKSQLTASREGLAILGVLAVLILPFSLGLDIEQIAFYDLLFWLLTGLFILAMGVLFKVKQLPFNSTNAESQSPWKTLKTLWVNQRSAFDIMPIYFLNNLANALPATLFLIFVADYLQLDADKGLFLVVYFLSGLVALPFWLVLSKKIGKAKTWQLSMLSASVSFSGVFLLTAGDFYGFLLITILTGLSLGIDLAMPASMQADITQKVSPKESHISGLLFGIWGMLTKFALAVAVGITFPLLDLVTLVDGNSQWALLMLYAGVPIILKIYAVTKLNKLI